MDPELHNPAYNDRHIVHSRILEGCRSCIHTTRKHQLRQFVFLITKQFRGKIVQRFYGKLKKFAEDGNSANKEETLIRDVFITNLIDPEILKEFLKQTVDPRQALELAINMEIRVRNHYQI